jgi:hypothetical protein
VTAGKTDVTVYFYIVQDASATSPGEPVTGLLFSDIETGGSASYARQGAARVDLTLVTQTPAGAHTDGGFVQVDATNMPGLYRCDYPDAAFATGVDQVYLQLVVAAAKNAVAAPIVVDLTDVDFRDSTSMGLSNLSDLFTSLINAQYNITGGSTTTITTNATRGDNYYNGQLIFVDAQSGHQIARNVNSYASASGTFTVDIMNFLPSSGTLYVLNIPAQFGSDRALVETRLDELILNAGAAPGAGSVLEDLMGASFATGTDSLEALRNLLDTRVPAVLSQANIETWSQTGAAAALVAIRLDELILNAGGAPGAGSVLEDLMGAGFLTATDSLEAIRNQGDSAWITAVGFSTHSAADAANSVWLELLSDHEATVGSAAEALFDLYNTRIPDVLSLANIRTQADDALVAIDLDHLSFAGAAPAPTAGSNLANIMGAGFLTATDSLEAIRNQGDSAWITAVGFSTHSAADAANSVWLELLSDHEATVGSAAEALFDLYNTRIPAVLSQANIETWSQTGAAAALAAIRLDELLQNAGGAPGAGSVFEDFMGATFATATDSLEQLRDRIDNRLPDALPLTGIRDAILPTQNATFDNLEFLFVAASDGRTPVTGATGTGVTRSIDGGAFGAGTGTLAEVGNGIYQYDASAADMNGGIITFRFTATGGTPGAPDDTFVTIMTGGGV